MPEWLQDAFQQDVDLSTAVLLTRMAAALALGCVVAAIYRWTRRNPADADASLTPTLVLLTVIIAMVTLAIGNSVARAFSLVGALAIVRFRTVVEDTRDTAFVIFAVAVGLAVGAGLLRVPLAGVPFAALAAFLFRARPAATAGRSRDFSLRVRIGVGQSASALLRETFDKHLEQASLTAIETARQGAALDLRYSVRLRNADWAEALVAELTRLESVQEVELRAG